MNSIFDDTPFAAFQFYRHAHITNVCEMYFGRFYEFKERLKKYFNTIKAVEPHHTLDSDMDKDRIAGAAKQAKGAIKEAAGKALGDAKLAAEGKSGKVEGKIQNAIGGVKDALKEKAARKD